MRRTSDAPAGSRAPSPAPGGASRIASFWAIGALTAAAFLAAQETAITALTFFGADEQGYVNDLYRWNTTYLDAAWDIALFEDDVPPAVPVTWLNNPDDYGVDVALAPGETRTFGFCVSNVAPGWYGLNIFFNGAQDPSPGAPGISVFAYTDTDGVGDPPPFAAIPAVIVTMGWPIAYVGGAESLVYKDYDHGVEASLVDFVVYAPAALGLDLVQPQEPGGLRLTEATDGLPDLVAAFTLEVEACQARPSDFACDRSPDGKTVDLSWTNHGPYDSLAIRRDGSEIAALDAAATSYRDSDAPPLTRVYEVAAQVGDVELGRSCTAPDPANPDVILTAITIYGTTAQGDVRYEERWNTLYLDAAWDVALHEGPLVTDPGEYDPGDPEFWLNARGDMSVRVPLAAGQERIFSFYMGRSALDADAFGLNLFFDGMQEPDGGTAGISVFTFTDVDGPAAGEPPAFAPDGAAATMGWPIADIPGAGTLTFTNAGGSLAVTLTDFVIYTQSAINDGAGIDLVQTQEPGGRLSIDAGDGAGDFTGKFTLLVEALGVEPSFRRGDVNVDGKMDIADPVSLLGHLFTQKPLPSCPDAADANDDGKLDIADAIRILGALFGGTGPLPAPGDRCGPDPTPADALPECVFPAEKCPP